MLIPTVAQNITSLQCLIPDRDRGEAGTAITFASMSVALVFVAMQIIVFTTMRHWGWDDILMVIATVCACYLVIYACSLHSSGLDGT